MPLWLDICDGKDLILECFAASCGVELEIVLFAAMLDNHCRKCQLEASMRLVEDPPGMELIVEI